MEYRVATRADTPHLTALWQQVFGDDEGFARMALQQFAGPGHVFVAGQGATPCAMLLAVPCAVDERKGIYLYGLATAPQLRGKGVMTALMAHAEAAARAAGAEFSLLIPAGEELFGFYRQRGYTDAVYLRHVALALPARTTMPAPGPFACAAPAAPRLQALRYRYIPGPHVAFAPARAALMAADLAEEGWQLAEAQNAYAVASVKQNTLLVAELGAADDAAAEALLYALAQKETCRRVFITLAPGGGLFAGQGVLHPLAQAKPLGGTALPQGIYFRFGLSAVQPRFLPGKADAPG